MRIITPYQILDGNTLWTRDARGETLEMKTGRGAIGILRGAQALRVWGDLLAEACIDAGLREDASVHEINALLEVRDNA